MKKLRLLPSARAGAEQKYLASIFGSAVADVLSVAENVPNPVIVDLA